MSRLRHYLTLGIIASLVYQASTLGFFQGQVAEAAFFNTGAIDLISGRKAFTTEATTIDNLYPLSVSGGLGREVDASIGGYNATNNVLVVSQATGAITVNLAIPAGTYSIDLGARFGKDSTNGEDGEQLRITSGSSSFNIPDQGDNFIFDNYHFEGFLVAENQTSFQIRGTDEGEVELGDIRISGTSTAANTTPPLSACAVTMNPTNANAGTEVSFHVSTTGGSTTKTFAYDFNGDGAFDLENTTGTAPFAYTRPGSFTVNIRVTDTIGGLVSCTTRVTINAANTPTSTPTPTFTPTSTPTPTFTPTSTPTPTITPTITPQNRAPVCTSVSVPSGSLYTNRDIVIRANATDANNDALVYQYNFGDGQFSSELTNPATTHRYTTAGTYTIYTQITDNRGGNSNCAPQTITILTAPTPTPTPTMSPADSTMSCVAFTASATTAAATTSITFNVQATSSNPTDVVIYHLNFGDGNYSANLLSNQSVSHSYRSVGSYTVYAQATDQRGHEVNCTPLVVTITTAPTTTPENRAPDCRLFSANDLTVDTNQTVTFSVDVQDADTTDATIYHINYGDGNQSNDVATSTRLTHRYTTAGTYTVFAQTTDQRGGISNCEPLTIVVTTAPATGNGAPTCTITSSTTTPASGANVTFTINATDPEGDVLSYAIDLGDGAGFVTTTRVSSRSFTTNRTISARVSDGIHLTTCSNAITITLMAAANRAPVCTVAISPTTITSNTAVVFTVTASDPDGDTLRYSYVFGDGNNQDSTNTTVSHLYTVANTYTARVSATDSNGATTPCTFTTGSGTPTTTITIVVQAPTPGNRAPVCSFVVSTLTTNTDTALTYTVAASDADGDALTYIYSFGDSTVRELNSNTTTYRFTSSGSFASSVSVRDARGLTSVCTNNQTPGTNPPGTIITIVVQPTTPTTNRAPVCTFTINTTNTSTTGDVTLTSQGSDADGDVITFIYNFGDGTIRQSTTTSTTYRYATAGSYTIRVSARDSQNATSDCTNTSIGNNPTTPTITVVITITPGTTGPQAPVCQIVNPTPGTTLLTNTELVLTATASDPDSSTLTYTFRFNDGSADTVNTTGIARRTFSTPGTYSAQISISDGVRTTNCAALIFTVNAPTPTPTSTTGPGPIGNRAPVCTAINIPSTAVVGSPVAITINATDLDNPALRYIINFGDGTGQTVTSATTYHTYSTVGTYALVAQVQDSNGVIVNCPNPTTALTITPASNANPICTSTSVTPTVIGSNTTVRFTATGSDADRDSLAFTFLFGDGQSTTNTSGIAEHVYNNIGSYVVQIQINDNRGGSTNCANTTVSVLTPNPEGPVCRALLLLTPNPTVGSDVTYELVPEHPENGPFWGTIVYDNETNTRRRNAFQRTTSYSRPGTYHVTSSLIDNFGRRSACPDLYVTVR